jgi:hypothetical protein
MAGAPAGPRLVYWFLGGGASLLTAIAIRLIGFEFSNTPPPSRGPSGPESPQIDFPASNQTRVQEGTVAPLPRKKTELGEPASRADPPQPAGGELAERTAQSDPRTVSKLIEILRDIASSYDPKKLSEIEIHLYSPNPVIRAEAVNAVLNLGDEAGAELLHRASRSMLDPREELETLEKAAFLRLPSGTFRAVGAQK